MKTIDLNFNFRNVAGEEIEGALASKGVSDLLAESPGGDYMKKWHWAKTLHDRGKLTLDPSDYKAFRAFVESSERMFTMAKAQVMEAIDNALEETTESVNTKK